MVINNLNQILVLTLLNIPKVGKKTIQTILKNNTIENIETENIYDLFIKTKINYKKITIPTKEDIESAKEIALKIISNSYELGINIMTVLNDDFPDKLKNINDNPLLLYYKGNKECIYDNKSVAIIGTRNPSIHGIKIAERLGYLFGKDGFTVISGLAKGCDEYAHKGCVDSYGKSIAVLPCGLDNIYPQSNKKLADEILKYGGCIVSEYPIGSKIFKSSFVERDRLQSALCQGLIVVEAAKKSGSMHTSNFALEQDKLIACYKPSSKNLATDLSGNIFLLEEKNALAIHNKETIEYFKDLIIKKSTQNNYNRQESESFEQLNFDGFK